MKSEHTKLLAVILVSAIVGTVVLSRSGFLGAAVPGVSAVATEQNVGVYWNENCKRSQAVYTIDWGMLLPGQTRDAVVYVRNEGNETFVLVCTPLNWNPENASRYLSLALNCEDRELVVGQVVRVTLSLSVSPAVTGDYDFSFDMILEGREFFLGDLNRDGSVDILDIATLNAAWGSTPTDFNWNPRADLNEDGVIDILDTPLLCRDFGKSW